MANISGRDARRGGWVPLPAHLGSRCSTSRNSRIDGAAEAIEAIDAVMAISAVPTNSKGSSAVMSLSGMPPDG